MWRINAFLIAVIVTLIIYSSAFADSRTLPGFKLVSAGPVSPEEAHRIIESRGDAEYATEGLGLSGVGSGDRIAELARGLKNDPNLIYKFVHDNIEYTPIYGCIKGPEMTLLDGRGNDFDQTALLVALFRQAGFTAHYVYGAIRLSPSQITDWVGVANDVNAIGRFFGAAGIPGQIWVYPDGSLAYVDLDHVWAKVNISGTNYVFDPSFKSYSSTAGIDLRTAMGYDANTFLARASAGTTIQPTYVQNINKANLTADMNSYSTNLVNYIRSNLPAATMKEVIGGRTIVPTTTVPRQTSLPYPSEIAYEWAEIPNAYKVLLRIQHLGIDAIGYSEQIYGKRLTIFYNASNQPVLAFEGSIAATGTAATPGTKQNITLTVDHPYAAFGGTYCDESRTFQITAGGSYFIVNGWAGTGTKIIEEHRKILKQNRYAGGSDTSEPVMGESLAMMAFTWLAEWSRAIQVTDRLTETTTVAHHTVGISGQYESPYIDMPMCFVSIASNTSDQSKDRVNFFASSGHMSAFEWGIVEQLQPHKAVSTVKLMDIANTGTYNKFFDTNSSNYTSMIKSQLHNYNSTEFASVESYINAGMRIILPQDGNLSENEWVGIGFLAISSDGNQISQIISGNLNGGYGVEPWIFNNVRIEVPETFIGHLKSIEPIDLVTGDYLYDNTDLTVGSGGYPFSLDFKRSYSSGEALDNNSLGLGWRHNLDITAKVSSDGFQGLGADSPIDAASSIAESYVSLDLLSTNKTNLRLTIATMSHRWFMDRLLNNIVTIDQPGNTMQFVKLADGNYNPPPGEAAKLTVQPDSSYLLKTKYGEYLDFDPNGKITTWSDPNNTVSFTYSVNGKLSQVSNGLGRSLTLTYDTSDANHIARATDSAGRNVYFGYDAKGNLTTTTDANGFTTTFVYDPDNDGRIKQIYYPTEPNNPFVTNVYDLLGRVKTQTNANGFTYQYYYTGYRTEEADPCGYSNIYNFNDYGRVVTQTDPLGNQTSYEYDGQLRKTLVTYPSGNTSRYIYDANHNVLQSIQIPIPASGEPNIVEAFTYEPNFNRVATYTDPNGQITTSQYYSNGKVRQIDQPLVDGNTPRTLFTYNSHGQTDTVTDPEGMVTKNQYDPNGNLISTIVDYGGLNITTSMIYNSIGDVNSITDPRGNTTRFEYDPMRRLIKTTSPVPFNYITLYEYYPDGSLKELSRQTNDPNQWQVTTNTYTSSGEIETTTDPNGDVAEYEYDALDRLWKAIDAENNTTTHLYDAAGRPWKVIDANNNSVVYTYNAAGSVDTLTDAKGNTTTYQYDGHNRLKKTILPDSTFEQLTYNIAGNISQKQTRGGQIINYSYDPLNRLKTKTLPGPVQIQYTYDLVGKTKTVTDVAGTIQHSYDKAGRLLGVIYPDGKSVSCQYDAGGNRTRLTYPDSSFVSYDYDNMNRLTYIRDANGAMVVHYDYDKLSRRTGEQFANGTSVTYSYNIADRLLTLNNQMVGASRSFAYGYDKVGNRLTMTTDGALLHQYNYDKIYQLTGADYPTGFFAADTNFVYDPAGNRESVVDGGTTNYISNNLNQYTSVAAVAYSYDDNGNLTDDGTNAYVYDAENRLTMVKHGANTIATYAYDFAGRRMSKLTTIDQRLTTYIYDGEQIIAEYDDSGILFKKLMYGTGIDEVIRMTTVGKSADMLASGSVNFGDFAVLAENWRLDSNNPNFNPATDLDNDGDTDYADLDILANAWLDNGTSSTYYTYYYHYDGLGSVIALSNSAGNKVEEYKYDVYGRVNTTGSVGNTYYFTGRQFDSETGLYYYRARYYSPVIGRFLQTDPVGYSAGVNWYAYCGNNPLVLVDPSGLCKIDYGSMFSGFGSDLTQAIKDGAYLTAYGASFGLIGDEQYVSQLESRYGGIATASQVLGGTGTVLTAAAGAVSYLGLDVALTGGTAAASNPRNQEIAYLYQKVSATGEHLKYGVTNNPATRYTQGQLAGGNLRILGEGSREEMLQLERSLHETLPLGSEEGQSFYIKIQLEKGLRP